MERNMTSGNSMKLLIGFMVPLIIGNIFQQMYSISDVIIVGRTIGVNALAAVGAAAPLFMLFVMMTMGLSNGFTVLVGQFYGAGDTQRMRHSVAMSTMLSFLLGLCRFFLPLSLFSVFSVFVFCFHAFFRSRVTGRDFGVGIFNALMEHSVEDRAEGITDVLYISERNR